MTDERAPGDYEAVPDDELRALIEADALHLLPVMALVATIKNLAEHLLLLQGGGEAERQWQDYKRRHPDPPRRITPQPPDVLRGGA